VCLINLDEMEHLIGVERIVEGNGDDSGNGSGPDSATTVV
jgi:hypothetical protein